MYENANPTCISTNGRGPFSKNPFRFFCVQFSILADIILFRRTLFRDYINRVIIHFYYNHGRRNQFNIEVLWVLVRNAKFQIHGIKKLDWRHLYRWSFWHEEININCIPFSLPVWKSGQKIWLCNFLACNETIGFFFKISA